MRNKPLLSRVKCKHIAAIFAFIIILCLLRSPETPVVPRENFFPEETLPYEIEPPDELPPVNYNVHIFYYAWYKSKDFDGKFRHWLLKEAKEGSFVASKFYPSLDLYSSRDITVIDAHMKMIRDAGVGVVVVGWVPPNHRDAPDLELILNHADRYGLKVTLQVLDYGNRTVEDLRINLKDFFWRHGLHGALYKVKRADRILPLIYIKNSEKILYTDWRKLFYKDEEKTFRGTSTDAFYIGTMITFDDHDHIISSGFDGFYTFHARNGYSYGSTFSSFRYFQEFADVHSLIFIPTIGPGHDNSRTQPSKKEQTVSRRDGRYYNSAWYQVLVSKARGVSINSFNDWSEGTQIEPAKSYQDSGTTFESYGEKGEEMYLELTRGWVSRISERWYQRSLI